jgi:hypothetical protein
MQGHARDNRAKVARILEARAGSAVLYRTRVAGPSGQRAQEAVARVSYTWESSWELAVSDLRTGETVGYLAREEWGRHAGTWVVHSHCDDCPDWELNRLLGWAESPAAGADVLVNGEHAANGNHDSARVSRGGWVRYVPRDDLAAV